MTVKDITEQSNATTTTLEGVTATAAITPCETNVVSFPASTPQTQNTETAIHREGTSEAQAPTALNDYRHVDQLAFLRAEKQFKKENQHLRTQRLDRLNNLKTIFSYEPLKLKGIEEIETMEKLLAEYQADTLRGQVLQYKKNMLAVYYSLPLEYIHADSNSYSIEGVNQTLGMLSSLVAKLPADSAKVRVYASRMKELQAIKTGLYQEMNHSDGILKTRQCLVRMAGGLNRLTKLIRGARSGRS